MVFSLGLTGSPAISSLGENKQGIPAAYILYTNVYIFLYMYTVHLLVYRDSYCLKDIVYNL